MKFLSILIVSTFWHIETRGRFIDFNIDFKEWLSCYMDSHYKDKVAVWASYLYNGNSYIHIVKMISLDWNDYFMMWWMFASTSWVTIISGNGLSPVQPQASSWEQILIYWHLDHFSEI